MADFINTVDEIGAQELEDRVIMRTLTEFKDSNIIKVASYGLAGFPDLVSVDLPNVVQVGDGAFTDCPALADVNLPKAETFGGNCFKDTSIVSICLPKVKDLSGYGQVFRDAKKLEKLDTHVLEKMNPTNVFYMTRMKALILRNTAQVCTLTAYRDIEDDCYIYVPKTMADGSDGVAAYRAATNWGNYGDKFRAIEDYPSITGG